VIGVDEPGAAEGSSGQGVVGERVDLAHQAAGAREERLEGRLGEEGTIDAGQTEAVLEVEVGGVAIETG